MQFELKTSMGPMIIELDPDKAPKTVENFCKYVDASFFNGTVFHRIIPDFMIQGGGFEPGLKQKQSHPPVPNEANNGLKNEYGTLAMARTGDPHSASSQFFINVKDNQFLDFKGEDTQGWGYCVFGKVVKGDDVLSAISKVQTCCTGGYTDVPVDDVIIEYIKPVDETDTTE